jgi:hypothetical protein
MINIELRFTEISLSANEGFRIPMNTGNVYPDYHRENGSIAKVVDFNRLIITTPYYTEEYSVSFELSGILSGSGLFQGFGKPFSVAENIGSERLRSDRVGFFLWYVAGVNQIDESCAIQEE